MIFERGIEQNALHTSQGSKVITLLAGKHFNFVFMKHGFKKTANEAHMRVPHMRVPLF